MKKTTHRQSMLTLSTSSILRLFAKACIATLSLFALWLSSPFLESAGVSLPLSVNNDSTTAQAAIPLRLAYGQHWVSMPTGSRTAYLGIQGGTVPLTLMCSPKGELIALPGRSGHDFLKAISGKTSSAQVIEGSSIVSVSTEDNSMLTTLIENADEHIIQHSTGAPLPTWVPFGLGSQVDDTTLSSENSIPVFGNGAELKGIGKQEAQNDSEIFINSQEVNNEQESNDTGKPVSSDTIINNNTIA